jgi:chromosome segregation ATPase
MNNIVLTNFWTGLLANGPDYLFVAIVLTISFVVLRDVILDSRRQAAKFREQETTNNSLRDNLSSFGGQLGEIKGMLSGLVERIRIDHKEFRDAFKEVENRITNVENRITNIQYTLKDIRNDIKIIDFKHNALETRVTKLESGDEKIPKSKQA